MVAEPLSVIRGYGDDGAVVEAARLEGPDQAPDELVRVGDLSVVGQGVAAIGRRRRVGRVRLVEMEESEEARALLGPDPARERLHGHGAVALEVADGLRPPFRLDGVVVEVEALRDPRRRPQNVGGDGRPRVQSGRLEASGQRGVIGREPEADVVAHAVVRGQEAGQHRGVRGQREGTVAVEIVEDDALAAEAVDVGSGPRPVAVEGKVIRAQGVDRDDDDGRIRKYRGGPARGRRPAGPKGRAREKGRERRAPHSSGDLTPSPIVTAC